jgi:hypothetical protein
MIKLEAGPTILFMFPESWLWRRQLEWEPLAEAASQVGFDVVVASWDAIVIIDGLVRASNSLLRRNDSAGIGVEKEILFTPDVTLTTWGVTSWDHQELFQKIICISKSLQSEVYLLAQLDSKIELENCLRNYERRTGQHVSRPETLLCSEISSEDTQPANEMLIIKPAHSGQCKGIEIHPRSAIMQLAEDASREIRKPFVAQKLVDNTFLYKGRRWDIRVHAMATSFSPLKYHLYPEGIAKTAGAAVKPGSMRLEEWLNAESFLEGIKPAENLPITNMLEYIKNQYFPLDGFWQRVDNIVRKVFEAMALQAEEKLIRLENSFLFPGFDFMVEREGETDYRIVLLELNSHPGLGWEPPISSALMPQFREWFSDLRTLQETRTK